MVAPLLLGPALSIVGMLLLIVLILALARIVFGLAWKLIVIAALVLGVLWLIGALSSGPPAFG